MKMIFHYDAKKTHFHNKSFALSLVLKVRFFGTLKWPTDNRFSGHFRKKLFSQNIRNWRFSASRRQNFLQEHHTPSPSSGSRLRRTRDSLVIKRYLRDFTFSKKVIK